MPYTKITPPLRPTGDEMRETWAFWGRHPDHSIGDYVRDPGPYQSYWDWAAQREYEYRLGLWKTIRLERDTRQ